MRRAGRRLEGLWFVLAKLPGRLSGGGKVSGGKGCRNVAVKTRSGKTHWNEKERHLCGDILYFQ